jgi:uncharacterized protein (DUF1501 family)
MDFTRRDFLKIGGLGLSALVVPRWLTTALAAPAEGAARGKTLVLIMLGGGNDGLNTVAPLADPLYKKLRPTLAIPKADLLALDDAVGLHPSMKKLRELFDEGKVSVVQNVGYEHADRSHFRSMEIWQTAQLSGPIRDGWLGRALETCDCPRPHAVSISSEIPIALASAGGGVLTLESPQGFDIAADQRHRNDRANIVAALREIYSQPREGPADVVRARGEELFAEIERVKKFAQAPAPATAYPKTPLANGLVFTANAIEAGFGARVYMIGLGGFDTHAGQKGSHQALLGQLSEALFAFQKDLEARGLADDVLTMTFSEFGRRADENASQGTDHGAAAPLFLVGRGVKGGVIGEAPHLDALDAGALAYKIDFRSVYAAVLEGWLGLASEAALGGKFAPVAALAAGGTGER